MDGQTGRQTDRERRSTWSKDKYKGVGVKSFSVQRVNKPVSLSLLI